MRIVPSGYGLGLGVPSHGRIRRETPNARVQYDHIHTEHTTDIKGWIINSIVDSIQAITLDVADGQSKEYPSRMALLRKKQNNPKRDNRIESRN